MTFSIIKCILYTNKYILLINLNNINSIKALSLLNKYSGKNPYLNLLRDKHLKGRLTLTSTQVRYVMDYHDKDPFKMNRVINITPYFGEELQKTHNLPFPIERILFLFLLAETDKAYHILGRLTQKQKHAELYWIPKTQVLDDPYWEEPNIDIDFTKYIEMDSLNRVPYNHQESGVKFLVARDGCILADSMGLGKTYQSIIAALEVKAKRVLIVCPSAVKIGWQREISCFGEESSIIDGKVWNPAKFTIINFDILQNFHTLNELRNQKYVEDGNIIHDEILNEHFDLVIVDEAHNLKNNKSIRGKIMLEICVKFNNPKVWLLSGTPVANRPMDFYNLLRLIKNPIVDNYKHYVQRYCEGKMFYKKLKNGKTKQIWLTNGASNLQELGTRTRNSLLRRLKEKVLDMPKKTITPVFHELTASQKVEYDDIWEEYLLERKAKKKKGSVDKDLVELILLRQYIANQAIEKTIEMVENAIDSGSKVIVFTNFQEEQDILVKHFGKLCVKHNGKMNGKNKQISVDRFQQDEKVKVFIGNIKSAGVGITLTAATTVIFNSLDWVPGNILQAIDRAYRIGQLNNVSVYFNLFNNTVDERVWKTLFSKTDVIETILNSGEEDNGDKNIFTNETDEDLLKLIYDTIDEDL